MPLLDALIPAREQRILRALVIHKDTAFSFNELIRIGGASMSAVAAIVDRLFKQPTEHVVTCETASSPEEETMRVEKAINPTNRFGAWSLVVFARWAMALVACGVSQATQAQSLTNEFKSFNAQLYEYFRELPEPLLPIFLPAGEAVGDAYRDKFGGFYARRKDCFGDLPTARAPSVLPGGIESSSAQLGGNVKADVQSLATAAANLGLRFADGVHVEFKDVEVFAASDVQLKRALLRRVKECGPVVTSALGKGSDDGVLVLGQVFVGKRVISTTLSRSGGAGASVSVDAGLLKKLTDAMKSRSFSASASVRADKSVEVRASSDNVLPFAYRPAFLSQSHLRAILSQQKRIDAMEQDLRKNHNVRALHSNYKDLVGLPADIARSMTRGTEWVPYSPTNPEHLQYMRSVGLLLAVGSDTVFR